MVESDSTSVLEGRKLVSGVILLLHNAMVHLLNSKGTAVDSAYLWKGMVIDLVEGTIYKPRKHDVFTYPKLSNEFDKDMFVIYQLHKRIQKVVNPVRTCTNLSSSLYILKSEFPELLQDYYSKPNYAYNLCLPNEKNQFKFAINLELIEKDLNWLHEHNVIMQTL